MRGPVPSLTRSSPCRSGRSGVYAGARYAQAIDRARTTSAARVTKRGRGQPLATSNATSGGAMETAASSGSAGSIQTGTTIGNVPSSATRKPSIVAKSGTHSTDAATSARADARRTGATPRASKRQRRGRGQQGQHPEVRGARRGRAHQRRQRNPDDEGRRPHERAVPRQAKPGGQVRREAIEQPRCGDAGQHGHEGKASGPGVPRVIDLAHRAQQGDAADGRAGDRQHADAGPEDQDEHATPSCGAPASRDDARPGEAAERQRQHEQHDVGSGAPGDRRHAEQIEVGDLLLGPVVMSSRCS